MVFKTLFKLHEGFKTVEQFFFFLLKSKGQVPLWARKEPRLTLLAVSAGREKLQLGLWQLQATLLGCLGDSSTLLAEQLSLF